MKAENYRLSNITSLIRRMRGGGEKAQHGVWNWWLMNITVLRWTAAWKSPAHSFEKTGGGRGNYWRQIYDTGCSNFILYWSPNVTIFPFSNFFPSNRRPTKTCHVQSEMKCYRLHLKGGARFVNREGSLLWNNVIPHFFYVLLLLW